MSDHEKIKNEVLIKIKEIREKERTQDYEKGFDDCLEIICSVFDLKRE